MLLVPGGGLSIGPVLEKLPWSAPFWFGRTPDDACVAAMAFVGLEKLPLPGETLEKRVAFALKPIEKLAASDVFTLMKRESLIFAFSISLF